MSKEAVKESNSTIFEAMLVMPALYIINRDGAVAMAKLIEELTELFNPEGLDAAILSGRSDTHFSQKVRNLCSHSKNNGMADYVKVDGDRYTLTDA